MLGDDFAFMREAKSMWARILRLSAGALVADVGGGLRLDEATAGPQG